MAAVGEEKFASDAELADIAKIRDGLAAKLEQLSKAGKDWPHLTGDIFMTRLLRGNNNSVAESIAWYNNFLVLREKHGLDDIHKRGVDAGLKFKFEQMPHAAEISKYLTVLFDEDSQRTPSGNLLWFDSYGDSRLQELMTEVGPEKLTEFFLHAFELRASTVDRLSREQGRMVKMCLIADLEGLAFSKMSKDFRVLQKSLDEVNRGTSVEVTSFTFVINAKPWFSGIFSVARKALPARVAKRLRLLSTDCLADPELLAEVGGPLLSSCLKRRHLDMIAGADDGALSGAGRVVPAGQVMERILDVTPGCQVMWDFTIGTGADTSRLGRLSNSATGESTDLTFQVKFLPELAQEAEDAAGALKNFVDVVEPTTVDDSHEQLTGKTVVDRKGIMAVTWSNQRSWVRSRVLENYKLVVNRPDDDVGSFHSGKDE